MSIAFFKRIYNTIKHLKFIQVYYRVFFLIRNKLFKKKYKLKNAKVKSNLLICSSYYSDRSFSENNTFTFLNKSKQFDDVIDWNYSHYGKLWTYNLNYFDFLNQEYLSKETGLKLIEKYISEEYKLLDGLEPYPLSLRSINWIKFNSKHRINNPEIDRVLFLNYKRLIDNLEYHLLGNHLLENAFSLLFGAYYFKSDKLYNKANKILYNQLEEQILDDGAHFELSPMYHQIILFRLLDSVFLIKNNIWKKDKLLSLLEEKASKMLSHLKLITFKDGNIPMVNDSTFNIAPSSKNLFNMARVLGIEIDKNILLSDSGYRKIKNNNYELFYDVGEVGPAYQPGHAHSDTFNFILYTKEKPFIVDRGVSTYEKNEIRNKERSTSSHNTVVVNQLEQTDVWGGFRVGKRANVIYLEESNNHIEAMHSGYKNIGFMHKRILKYDNDQVIINDIVLGKKESSNVAMFHFHPNVKINKIESNTIYFEDLDITIIFEGNISIRKEYYNYSLGFNKTEKASKLFVDFKKDLTTLINF